METCTQSTSLYMFLSCSIFLLFITKETTLGLTQEDAKTEYDQVEMPVSSRDFDPQVPKTSLTPFVVELSIICDKDFGDLFHHNIVNISNYWKTYIWDVNNRFKTLTKTNITYYIASIRVIRVTNWAPIEKAKESGKVKLAKFLPEFAKWTYTRWNASRPLRYDVVIGVTGLSFTGIESGYSYRNGSCNFNHRDSKIYSTAVFTDRGDFRVGTLSHELAHILGAKHDYDCEEKPRHYIMDYSNWRGVSLQFKFSQCSDEDISNFLKYPTTSYCLKVQNSNHIEYRANDDPEVVPPNMNEQCRRLFGNETAILVTSEYSEKICQRMECGLKGTTGEVEFIKPYTPVDNSRCGKTGVCFRGTCRPGLALETVDMTSFTSAISATGASISKNITTTTISTSTTTPTSLTRTSTKQESIICPSSMTKNVVDNILSNASGHCLKNVYTIYFVNVLIVVHLLLNDLGLD